MMLPRSCARHTVSWSDAVRVLLVPNVRNPEAVAAAVDAYAWLVSAGVDVVLAPEDAEACGLHAAAVERSRIGTPGLVLAFGGDGTILKAVHLVGDVEAPVLGVNLGNLGFMSGAGREDMREAMEAALAGEVVLERRSTLRAEVHVGGRQAGVYRALNEVFVGRGSAGRSVEATISVNGTRVGAYTCDGVIVATPTGSTAYALSAGGPVVAPSVSGLIVVPVAPHVLGARAIVAGASDVVEVAFPDPGRADACLTIDGDAMPCRQSLERLVVTKGEHDVVLARHVGRDFYEVYRDEFCGG